jgi:hypothetical protein
MDLNTRILTEIRDEMRAMHQEQRATNERLDHLERRQTEDATRLATELSAVAHAVGQVRDLLRDGRVDRSRMDDLERRVTQLERKSA